MDSFTYLLSSSFVRMFAQAEPVPCNFPNSGFFGIPTWYQYLTGVEVLTYNPLTNMNENICSPSLNGVGDFWLVGLAIIDILLRVIGVVAVGWIIWGGLQYLVSQGEPDRTKKAKDTVLNAFIGVVITMTAVVLIRFLAGQFN